jgi:hypothetical protein
VDEFDAAIAISDRQIKMRTRGDARHRSIWGAFLFQTFEVLPPFPRADSKADLARLRSRQKDWVRFAKNGPPVLTASALAASEGGHLVRHRSRR